MTVDTYTTDNSQRETSILHGAENTHNECDFDRTLGYATIMSGLGNIAVGGALTGMEAAGDNLSGTIDSQQLYGMGFIGAGFTGIAARSAILDSAEICDANKE
jgi:hypothetical protein